MGSRNTTTLQFRVPVELAARLDAQAAEMRVSRAALIRLLVENGMGDPIQLSMLNEVAFAVSATARATMGRLLKDIVDRLPELVEEEMQGASLLAPPAAE